MANAKLKPEGVAVAARAEDSPEESPKPTASLRRPKQLDDAKKHLGSLSRVLHRLGLYEKVRPQLIVIEKELRDGRGD